MMKDFVFDLVDIVVDFAFNPENSELAE